MLWTALVLGFVGSTHCLVMCGPLTLLLPGQKSITLKTILAKLSYNLGRIISYVSMGLLIGIVGSQFLLFTSQKSLSITFGIILLVLVAFMYIGGFSSKLKSFFTVNASLLKSWVKRTLKLSYLGSHFTFGLVNGLLPCGLSFTALAGAFLLLDPIQAGLYMLLFGLGTLPMMFIASLGFSTIVQRLRFNYKRLIPITFAAMAIWLIFRGMNDQVSLYGNDTVKAAECVVVE